MSKYKEYLKSIGAPASHITALEKAEADDKESIDIPTLCDEYKSTQKKLLENDPDLVKGIAAKEKGKVLDIVTRDLKRAFNLDSAAIKDKDIDEVIKIAKEESVKGVSKDLQTIQQENTELVAKVKEYEEVKIPQIKSEVEAQKKGFLINTKLQKKLPAADLRVPTETVDLVLNAQLAALYDLDIDDKGEIIIYNKGSKLQAQSADKSKLLTIDDVMGDILKKNKFVKESNADDTDPANGKKIIQPNNDPKKVDPNKMTPAQKKAFDHMKELEKSATVGKAQ